MTECSRRSHEERMLDDIYEFVVNWDDGWNVQVKFVESSALLEEMVRFTPKQIEVPHRTSLE